jgi:glycosyltransferase involved in cell wall biosynthesis
VALLFMGCTNVSGLVGDSGLSRRLLYLVNDSAFFVSHRLSIALAAKKAGYDVVVATAEGERIDEITGAGLEFISLPLKRGSLNILSELRLFIAIVLLFRSLKPDIVHLVTIKPVLYGGIVARLLHVHAVVYAISGMGYLFTNERGGIVRSVVEALYRFALGNRQGRVIVQNNSDRDTLQAIHALPPGHDVLIPGSGVDLTRFNTSPINNNEEIIVLPARMLWDKGVGEFVTAARLLRQRGMAARFVLVGEYDAHNPASISRQQLKQWQDERVIEWWGYQYDMPSVMAKACLVVLPSYREGLPKVLVEAAAAGRAIVTTDAPGCRDVVVQGRNGLLVPIRDAVSLADAMYELLKDRNRLASMGFESRKIAEARFGLEKIVAMHLNIYNLLTNNIN